MHASSLPQKLRRLSQVCLSACLAAGLATVLPARAECPPPDSEAVGKTLRALYGAAQDNDEAGLRALLDSHFVSLEDDQTHGLEEVIATLQAEHGAGLAPKWAVSPPEVHFHCDTAWATYAGHSTFHFKDSVQESDWWESAVLYFTEGRWRVQFVHTSHRLDAGAEPESGAEPQSGAS